MKRLLLVLLLVLIGVAAKPHNSMAVTYEQQTCGYECNLTDGILGADENLTWQAGGSLTPGETFVYTYQPSSRPRYIYTQAYTYKGPYVPLRIDIQTDVGSATGIDTACFILWPYGELTNWSISITNVGDRTARRAYAWGQNQMKLGQTCP